MNDDGDDHYIPDIHNAHIDTRDFESDLESLAQGLTGPELDRANLWSRVHDLVMSRLSGEIEQPSDEALICRYLSPTKFLWFIRAFEIYFGSASAFEDKADCGVPQDYNHCVQQFFLKRGVLPIAWDDHAEKFRADWLVSSWTELTDHHDDYLLWQRYAGGPYGVGITIQYCHLNEFLKREFRNQETDKLPLTDFTSGKVSYGAPLRIPPFSKRRIFRNEKEIRFVCRGFALAAVPISIASLKERLGLRFSPDAPRYHIDAVLKTWIKFGGNDRYQIAGE